MKNRMSIAAFAGTAILTINGCSGGLSSGFDADGFATAAIEQADSNGDGKLSADELEKNPGLLAALGSSDKDRDGSISLEELKNRLTSMQKVAKYTCRPSVYVYQGRRPLSGATVRFVPEAFIANYSQVATGVTDASGQCNLVIEGNDNGFKCGFYRVEITHPSKKLPASANTETMLGAEVSLDLGRSSEELSFTIPKS